VNLSPRRLILVAVLLVLGVYPLVASAHGRFVATTAVIFAIAAVGLALVVVHVGLVSLGHAAFFGIGAYTSAILTTRFGLPVLVGLLAAVLTGALYGVLVGPLALRSRGLFFVMITLAFAQLVFVIAGQWVDITGGDTGISSIPRTPWGAFDSRLNYVVTVVVLAAVLAGGSWLVRTGLGRSVVAARQDEVKAAALGYDVRRGRLILFVVSAAVAGLAGALYVHHTSFVSPVELYWTTSGELLVMVLIGGGQTLIGAALGAYVLWHVEDYLAIRTDLWELVVGLLFIAVVLTGLTRADSRLSRALVGRQRRTAAAEASGAAPPVADSGTTADLEGVQP
jgi:branched-chain amino acid transport system permease protein